MGLKACSHEPGTVNSPGVMIASITSRSHYDLLSRVNSIASGQVQGTLITEGLVHMNPRGSDLPQGNDCPGASVNSRSLDDLVSPGNVAPGQLHCPRASSSTSDHYEFI